MVGPLEQILPRHLSLPISIIQEQIVRCKQTNKALLVERGLKMLGGANNTQAAHSLSLHRDTARYWRGRWRDAHGDLTQAEQLVALEDETTLLRLIEEILIDSSQW